MPGPYGVAFDGSNIWLSGDSIVVELRPIDGKVLTTVNYGPTGGIAFDGANIWVSNTDTATLDKL